MSTGGITVVATVNGALKQADLPYDVNWRVAVPRLLYSEMSLAGTMIHQCITKTYTAGTASYSMDVPEAEADALQAIDEGATACVIADGKHVYEATIDTSISPKVRNGKRRVDMEVTVIRKVL